MVGFQVISLTGRFAASYFFTVPLLNTIPIADHFVPSCCFVELFSRMIVTLNVRVVLSALRIIFLCIVGNYFVVVKYLN